MQTRNLAFLIEQATAKRSKHPLVEAVRDSIEVGVVVPSRLRSRLEEEGLKVAEDATTMAEYGFGSLSALKRVLVTDAKGAIIAMGAAGDHDEALLHAMLGWFRENPLAGSDVPAGIASLPQ